MPEVEQNVRPSDTHLEPQLSLDLLSKFDESESIVARTLHELQDGRVRRCSSAEILLELLDCQAELVEHRDCANEAFITDCCVGSQGVSITRATTAAS